MILLTETLIRMADVPDYLAGLNIVGKNAKPIRPQLAGIYRWAKYGCRGVRLEAMKANNRMYTSGEALARFFAACANQPTQPKPPVNRGMSREEARRLLP